MTLIDRFQPAAEKDYDWIAMYLAERNVSAAWRFCESVEKTVAMLCRTPAMGEMCRYAPNRGIRLRGDVEFPKYLIFYRVENDTLLIVRVLHGSRDYANLF